MITYWRRIKCVWVKVTTTVAEWASLPHVQLGAAGCSLVGVGVIVGVGIIYLPAKPPAKTWGNPAPPSDIIAPQLLHSGDSLPAWDALHPRPTPTDEPATALLLLAGVAGLAAARRRVSRQ